MSGDSPQDLAHDQAVELVGAIMTTCILIGNARRLHPQTLLAAMAAAAGNIAADNLKLDSETWPQLDDLFVDAFRKTVAGKMRRAVDDGVGVPVGQG